MATLRYLLEDLTQVGSVAAAIVVSRDGFVIDAARRGREIELDALGAGLSTCLSAFESTGTELRLGGLCHTMAEFETGVVMVWLLNADAALAIVAEHGANLGYLRHQLRKRRGEIVNAL